MDPPSIHGIDGLKMTKVLDGSLTVPPGYKFYPTDGELIEYYLKAKINGDFIIPGRIHDVDVYKHPPNTLDMYKRKGEQHMYFFTRRNRKYPNGSRPDRAVGSSGFWKATGKDCEIRHNGSIIGMKKSLVFYEGQRPKNVVKTNWHMQEFTLKEETSNHQKGSLQSSTAATHKFEDWALCKIYQIIRNQNVKEVSRHGVAVSTKIVSTPQYDPNQHKVQQHQQADLSCLNPESNQFPNLPLPQFPMPSSYQTSTLPPVPSFPIQSFHPNSTLPPLSSLSPPSLENECDPHEQEDYDMILSYDQFTEEDREFLRSILGPDDSFPPNEPLP